PKDSFWRANTNSEKRGERKDTRGKKKEERRKTDQRYVNPTPDIYRDKNNIYISKYEKISERRHVEYWAGGRGTAPSCNLGHPGGARAAHPLYQREQGGRTFGQKRDPGDQGAGGQLPQP